MEWAFAAIMPRRSSRLTVTLWYRPIQAIKFGLQYAYAAANYFQYLIPRRCNCRWLSTANTVNRSNFGDDHRVEFVGFFYF